MPPLRKLFVLGRVSNVPTVWSNCLAGWWLAGAGNPEKLPLLLIGTTFLYVGGMYLNDVFDAEFDHLHRPQRPIPSGTVSERAVWRLGLLWLALGAACLMGLGDVTGSLGLALTLCIVIYNAVHKPFVFSPVLMGLCRFFVYVVAASIGIYGVTGWAIWCGLALAVYVAGLSFLARRESQRGQWPQWPMVLLGAPILLALLMNSGGYFQAALLLSVVLGLWVVRCLRLAFWSVQRKAGRAVAGLLAGIVLVDLLAVADAPGRFSLVFLVLFAVTLILQRFVPAT
ncbi:MAG TPA: UbiA family prenyltransferase [Verrucomicrobiae bacterium]|nr:UbiA family prenyltransferase [Verrucomicrobiae bacterium]